MSWKFCFGVTDYDFIVGNNANWLCWIEVEKVVILNRKLLGLMHPKLAEIIHKIFSISPALLISSVGIKEPEYYQKTYVLTTHVAENLADKNPSMVFCYVSGSRTEKAKQGRTM